MPAIIGSDSRQSEQFLGGINVFANVLCLRTGEKLCHIASERETQMHFAYSCIGYVLLSLE